MKQWTYFKTFENEAVDIFRSSSEGLGVPLYVGQYPQLLEEGSMRSPCQAEYLGHFIAEEKNISTFSWHD